MWRRHVGIGAAVGALALGVDAEAGLIEFDSFESWTNDVGAYTTIPFTGFEELTVITDQYQDEGVVFRSFSFTRFSPPAFLEDEWGLASVAPIDVRFDDPVTSIAMHFPGSVDFRFYLEDELLLETKNFYGPTGVGNFIGITPGFEFDRVEILDLAGLDDVVIDNLYFTPIPAPAAALLMLGPILVGRRRR